MRVFLTLAYIFFYSVTFGNNNLFTHNHLFSNNHLPVDNHLFAYNSIFVNNRFPRNPTPKFLERGCGVGDRATENVSI